MLMMVCWVIDGKPSNIQAQEQQQVPAWSGFGIEVNALAGKVYKHEARFTLPIPSLTTGADINFMVHTFGRKAWSQRCHYPTVGIGLTYVDYGIDNVYGRSIGIYPNIELPLLTLGQLRWTVRLGDGIGYVSQHYSRLSPVDTVNVAIGSHINDFAYFTTDLRYTINDHWELQAGGHFNHISDASFRKPNLGINMYGAHIGIRYFPVTAHPQRIRRTLPPLSNRWLVQARVSMAMVSGFVPNGPIYPVYLLAGMVSRRWMNMNKAFAGIDYSRHQEVYAYLIANDLYRGNEWQHAYKSAIFVGNEFMFGRVGVVGQVGAYIHQAYLREDDVYEKIGGNFYIVQHERGPIKELSLCAFLKTHKTHAELGEFGIGVSF